MESECLSHVRQAQERLDTCSDDCEQAREDVRVANANLMAFRERHPDDKKPLPVAPRVKEKPSEKSSDKYEAAGKKLSPPPEVPPPPGCTKDRDGAITCPPVEESGKTGDVIPCGESTNGKPPPSCGATTK